VPSPEAVRTVARGQDGTAGVYAAVLAEGMIRAGDPAELLD
jgi:MOSC domain-containing protein YiiM